MKILRVLTLCVLITHPASPNLLKGMYNLLFTHNFHAIEPGVAYRSGSMPPHKMARKIIRKNIKSVINLRAGERHSRWRPHQKVITRTVRKNGRTIHFYNIASTARSLPSRATVIALLNAFKHAPRPVMIHCRSGADRTSEAAALWQITQQKKSKREALKQLSTTFGHISARFPDKRRFIMMLPDNPHHVEKWLRTQYRPTLAITAARSVP